MSHATTHIRLLPHREEGALATLLPVFTRLARRLEEYYCLLRWRWSRQSAEQTRWFERLLCTRPAPERKRRYWRNHANLTMCEWLCTIPSCDTLWNWGRFRRPVRQGFADALLPSLTSIVRNQHESTSVRTRAITALANLDAEGVEPVLLSVLGDPSKAVRMNTAKMLSKMGFKPESLAPELLLKLQSKKQSERSSAARAVAILRLATPELLHQLLALMRKGHHHTVRVCAYALSELGEKAEPALPDLRELVHDPWIPTHVQDEAKKAERKILLASSETLRESLMDELAEHLPFLRDD